MANWQWRPHQGGGRIKEAQEAASRRPLLSIRANTNAARRYVRNPSRQQQFRFKRNRESWIQPSKQTQTHLTYHNRAKCLSLMPPMPVTDAPVPVTDAPVDELCKNRRVRATSEEEDEPEQVMEGVEKEK